MGWETGLMFMGAISVTLIICWFGLQCSVRCFNKIDIKPLVMWFKMFSFIFGATFLSLSFLYIFIGD